jgi:hypothetical protein
LVESALVEPSLVRMHLEYLQKLLLSVSGLRSVKFRAGPDALEIRTGSLISSADPGRGASAEGHAGDCQHARAVAMFTAPHEDRAVADLCGAPDSLQRYRAGRDECIPHCDS